MPIRGNNPCRDKKSIFNIRLQAGEFCLADTEVFVSLLIVAKKDFS